MKPKQHADGLDYEVWGLRCRSELKTARRLVSAINLVRDELGRAGAKFPEWPDDMIHRAALVTEEAGELVRAALQYTYEDGDTEAMRREAVHTAAMALRFLVNLPKGA